MNALGSRIPLAVPNYGTREVDAIVDVLRSGNVTQGEKVAAFEQRFLEEVGAPTTTRAAMVNSGSSANLLAAALWAHLAELRGDVRREVIMPALTWSTTVAPFVQHGFKPVFVDVGDDYCVDPAAVRDAVTDQTIGIVAVHLLGNPCNMEALTHLARANFLLLHEDCCEALGSHWGGKQVGCFGDTASYSFYLSHHITTIEGGMLLWPAPYEEVLAMREHGWVRKYGATRRDEIAGHNPTLHPTWTFDQLGYNVRATELQAAMGLVQLDRHAAWRKARVGHAHTLDERLRAHHYHLWPRVLSAEAIPNPFNYPIRVRPDAPFSRDDLVNYLEAAGVETRPVMTGNITRHPWYRRHPDAYRVAGSLTNTDAIHDNAFLLPCAPHLTSQDVERVADTIDIFLEAYP